MKTFKNKPFKSIEHKVMSEFAKRLSIAPMQIIEHNKSAHISNIRQLYCKLRHDRHGMSYAAIGHEIGRSHSTVKYGVVRINRLLRLHDKKISWMWSRVKDISGLNV